MTEEIKTMPTGLYWQGKKTEVDRIVLPFQTIETINESRATREKEKKTGADMFKEEANANWHNRLIWGDNKYVMASLLPEFAGKIDLIYIDPPFATGADFSVKMEIGDASWTKEPSAIEDKAYRDTWGRTRFIPANDVRAARLNAGVVERECKYLCTCWAKRKPLHKSSS